MAVLVTVECNVKPEHADDLVNFLRNELHHTRGFDGCHGLTIHRNQDAAHNMVFVEHPETTQLRAGTGRLRRGLLALELVDDHLDIASDPGRVRSSVADVCRRRRPAGRDLIDGLAG